MISGLLLSSLPGTPAADVLTPQRDPAAEKLLGAPATSRRDFSRAETLSWMTEIYDNSPAKQPKQFDVIVHAARPRRAEKRSRRAIVLKNGDAGAPKWQTFAYTGRIPAVRDSAGTIPAADRSARSQHRVE